MYVRSTQERCEEPHCSFDALLSAHACPSRCKRSSRLVSAPQDRQSAARFGRERVSLRVQEHCLRVVERYQRRRVLVSPAITSKRGASCAGASCDVALKRVDHTSRALRFGPWWSAPLVKGAARAWVCLRLGAALLGSAWRCAAWAEGCKPPVSGWRVCTVSGGARAATFGPRTFSAGG